MTAVMVMIGKAVSILLILFLAWCISNLYKVFERIPDRGNDKGWIAFGMMAEVMLMIMLALKIITG